jgi:hypothetical protein
MPSNGADSAIGSKPSTVPSADQTVASNSRPHPNESLAGSGSDVPEDFNASGWFTEIDLDRRNCDGLASRVMS